MATPTRRPASATRRRKSSGARRGPGAPRRRPPAGARAARARRPRRRQSRIAPAVRAVARGVRGIAGGTRLALVAVVHAPAEVWGALALLLGAAAGAGIYGAAAGPAGAIAGDVVAVLLGRVRVLAPPVILVAGALVIVPRTRAHVGRIVVGSLCSMLALAGLLHLARGNLPLSAPLDRLRGAGGIVGALAARPASNFVGSWPVWVLLLALLGLGVMVLTRTPVSRVAGWAGDALWSAADFVRALARGAPHGEPVAGRGCELADGKRRCEGESCHGHHDEEDGEQTSESDRENRSRSTRRR
jgi:S-DNA-T family DNA segregation ATPase FtsK/SpoIIIE